MINLVKVISNKINTNLISVHCNNYVIPHILSYTGCLPANKSVRIVLQLVKLVILRSRAMILFLLMFISISVNAEDVENDKQQHFIAETVICGATMMYTESWWQTMLVGLSIGVLKESYDSSQEGNIFDKNDMAANILGCAAGVSYGATVLNFHYESESDSTVISIEGKF